MFKWLRKFFKKEVVIKPYLPEYYEIAKKEIGVKEVDGDGNNPRVIEYHQATSLKASEDKVAWCAAFCNYCLKSAGIEGTNSALARSFLKWGRSVDEPREGDIVILWRGKKDAATGHVGFYVKTEGDSILMLGGNQSNEVCIAKYPIDRILGYRRV